MFVSGRLRADLETPYVAPSSGASI